MDKREWTEMEERDMDSRQNTGGMRYPDKERFLEELRSQLADLTDEERREALEYYEEYFADAGEENEDDVIRSLGAPEQVAKQIRSGLHKEEEGMFTENGYRENLENDNPPEVYGKKAEERESEEQKGRGPLPWGWEKHKKTGRQSAFGSFARGDSGKGGRYGNGSCADGQQAGSAGSYDTGGQSGSSYRNGYDYGAGRQAGKKKEKMSGGMIALLVVLCIFASPVILGLGASLFGIVLGVLGAVIGVIAAFFAVVIALLAAGVALFFAGFAMLFVRPFGGMICMAVGCFLIALFLVCLVLLVAVFRKFFPWLIKEVEDLGKYLSRKWSERKGKGEAA